MFSCVWPHGEHVISQDTQVLWIFPVTLSYLARHTSSLDPPSQSVLSRKTHTRIHRVCLLSLTSHPWHRHGAAAPRSSTALSVTVKTLTLEVHSDLRRKTHWDFIQVYLESPIHDESTSARSWRRSAAHGTICNCEDTRNLTSQRPLCFYR